MKNLRIKRSDVAKILKHLETLRRQSNELRVALMAIKITDGLWKEETGETLYGDAIECGEQAIASAEKEMEDLRKALKGIMRTEENE